ncbi:lipase family protein [Burkholderia sp. BCC1993]|uniref:lipase family protein n=1 Tax=Burkholderia sp. BCC1993 TaxID=2817444 RepID=UPI002AAFCD83|nr:lipase family protein [Burkholderia sp. BCC1993]
MADICALSWFGRSYRDVRYLNAWLEQGFAVIATDYQGLGTPAPNPQLNNRSNSYTLLDSVRAELGGVPGFANEVVLAGRSPGGSAVSAAAGYAPVYALELLIRATVATGTIYNASHATLASLPKFETVYRRNAERVDPTLAYQFDAVLSAQQIAPSLRAEEVLAETMLPILEQARISCLASLEDDAALAHLFHAHTVKPGRRCAPEHVVGRLSEVPGAEDRDACLHRYARGRRTDAARTRACQGRVRGRAQRPMCTRLRAASTTAPPTRRSPILSRS